MFSRPRKLQRPWKLQLFEQEFLSKQNCEFKWFMFDKLYVCRCQWLIWRWMKWDSRHTSCVEIKSNMSQHGSCLTQQRKQWSKLVSLKHSQVSQVRTYFHLDKSNELLTLNSWNKRTLYQLFQQEASTICTLNQHARQFLIGQRVTWIQEGIDGPKTIENRQKFGQPGPFQ